MLLQMAKLHSFLLLNNIPVYVIYTYIHIVYMVYVFYRLKMKVHEFFCQSFCQPELLFSVPSTNQSLSLCHAFEYIAQCVYIHIVWIYVYVYIVCICMCIYTHAQYIRGLVEGRLAGVWIVGHVNLSHRRAAI